MAKETLNAAAPAAAPANQGGNKDAVLNLFQTEVKEDNVLGKLADSLEEIDAADLLKRATDIRNKLKGLRG
jgi:hypothetical protein